MAAGNDSGPTSTHRLWQWCRRLRQDADRSPYQREQNANPETTHDSPLCMCNVAQALCSKPPACTVPGCELCDDSLFSNVCQSERTLIVVSDVPGNDQVRSLCAKSKDRSWPGARHSRNRMSTHSRRPVLSKVGVQRRSSTAAAQSRAKAANNPKRSINGSPRQRAAEATAGS